MSFFYSCSSKDSGGSGDRSKVGSVQPVCSAKASTGESVPDWVKVDSDRVNAVALANTKALEEWQFAQKHSVHVDRPLTLDEKSQKAFEAMRARQARGRVSTGKRGGKSSEVRTILNFTGVTATSAGVDFAGVITLAVSNATEWSSFATIWDEVIVDGGHFDFTNATTTAYTTTSGANRAVVCYDPLDSAALSSLSNGLQHAQHLQFTGGAGLLPAFPTVASAKGYHSFRFKVPRGSARSNSGSPTVFGHDWSSTGDTGDSYGYIKFYVPSIGATGITSLYYTWTLNVRFRCRT